MRKLFLSTAVILMTTTAAIASPVIGEPAPAFKGMDTNGVQHELSDFKGKIVVLEWTNHECPYVKKHYDSGNMQSLQKEAVDMGVVWLSVASSAAGKQGQVDNATANHVMSEVGSNATARIQDPSGAIGHLYEAKTTPHMFVIDKEGTLAYAGAIDSDNSFKPSAIEGATNYVREAIHALEKGEGVTVPSTQPYGCSVKY